MHPSRPPSAATDVPELVTDLGAGLFEQMLSTALSECAAATIDHGRKSVVTIKMELDNIPGTHQLRMQHDIKYNKPTSMGKSGEETSSTTVLHVGRYGALSLSQPSLFEPPKQTSIPGADLDAN
jgi:hypothetical protein